MWLECVVEEAAVVVAVAASGDWLEGCEVSINITPFTREHTKRDRNHKIFS